jgi:tetratricopeptide (TPR) repeat protein
MTPERRQKIRAVFDSAVEQPSAAVDEFVRRACGGDQELYNEVQRLLAQHRQAASAPSVFHAGQTVANRYRIVRYLSRGGMGEVYQAQDLDLGPAETVALKTLLPEIAGDESMIARFKQEIALSRKISHPNVCRVFDLTRHQEESGRPVFFLTMEFLSGETLAAKLRRDGRLSPAEALPLIEQMGAALDASHAAGVIHRDFKPSNVMLVPAGSGARAVVTDFGLARRFIASGAETASMSEAVVGTLDYMAPELLMGAVATFASDIYALGLTAYKMVAGCLPFTADTPLAAAMLRANRPIPSPRGSAPGLDAQWERALLRALDPKPGQRFSTASDFLAALRGESTAAVKTPLLTRRRAVIAAALPLMAVGAVLGWREWVRFGQRLPAAAEDLYRKGSADIAAGAYFAATKALTEAAEAAPRSAPIHARLAEAWLELELPEKASEEMLLARRQDLSVLSKTDRLRIEAIDLAVTHDYAAAAAKYEEIARNGGGADIAMDLGRAYDHAGQPDKAMRSYLQAAEGPEANPAAWLRLGVLYALQAKNAQSGKAFAQAERLYQLTSNLEGLTEVTLQQGVAATTADRLDAGAAFLQKALATARLAGNLQQEISATLQLSTNAYLSGDAALTEHYARDALETARSHQLDALAIRGLVNLGNASVRKQDFARAEQYYQEALNLARQTRSERLAALSLISLAGVHDQTRDYQRAVSEAREALTFYQANRYAKASLQCLTIMARNQRNSGDFVGALQSFRNQLASAEKNQDRFGITLAQESIGAVLLTVTGYPEALDAYRKSLEFATDDEHTGYASLGCASALWRLGKYPEAAQMFAKADSVAATFPRLRASIVPDRAKMLVSQGHYQQVIDMARGLLTTGGPQTGDSQADLREAVGLALLRAGNRHDGLKRCEEAWAATSSGANPAETVEAGLALLDARVENGEKDAALQVFKAIEPRLAVFPEWEWRALALAARVDASYASRAKDALTKFSRQWEVSVYNTYLTRPDVEKLSRPLLRPVSPRH